MWIYILIALSLYVMYVLITYIFGMNRITKELIPNMVDAKDTDIVKAKSMPVTPFGQGTRASYGFWIYLNDMNYKFGSRKYIFEKRNPHSETSSISLYLQSRKPNIQMKYVDSSNPIEPKTVDIGIIPLKKWQHISVIQDGNIMDVFLNGRLVFSSDPAVQVLSTHGEDIIMSNGGGWSGYKAKLEYSNYNWNMMEIRSKLEAGPLQMSWMNPLFYVYMGVGYLTELNDQILTYFLPDPEKVAQKAHSEKQTAAAGMTADDSKDKACGGGDGGDLSVTDDLQQIENEL